MPPFRQPTPVALKVKDRLESMTVHGDRLYAGTSNGTLYVYDLNDSAESSAGPIETKKSFSRRSIDQLCVVKDINCLAVLSDSQVTLYPLPSLSPPTPLPKAKAAFSFAVDSSVQHLESENAPKSSASDSEFGAATPVPVVPSIVTQIVIGCQRKLVVYSWHNGDPQDPKETPLAHSPRAIAFLNSNTLCMAYSVTEQAMFSLDTFAATDITLTPSTLSAGTAGMTALTGLTGYMTLGLMAKPKPSAISIGNMEGLILKDNEGHILGKDGKQSRPSNLIWPAPPADVAFVKPYIFAALPPGSVPISQISGDPQDQTASAQSTITNISAVLQIRSATSLLPVQVTGFPPSSAVPNASSANQIRLLTPSPSAKAPLYLVTTPTDRTAASTDGSTIWKIEMRSWPEQVDELVKDGSYSEALALLDTLDQTVLPDKPERVVKIRALNAVAQFRAGKFDDAINTFIELDFNPAKVVALYPASIAGRFSVPQERWIQLYGGPAPLEIHDSSPVRSPSESTKEKDEQDTAGGDGPERAASPAGSVLTSKLRTGLGALLPAAATAALKDDDTASIAGSIKQKRRAPSDDFTRSVDTLLRFLTDRRPKLAGALAMLKITPSQAHTLPFLSTLSNEDIFQLPNAPLSSLSSEQLLRYAQVVDTVLFKSYLVTRPALLASLVRVSNWCEVSEVEGELRAREKFTELVYLYNGKQMHANALELLKQLSEKETDMSEKLSPSISYLQRLGPEHIDVVFKYSRWLFDEDENLAFEIFLSEDVTLPATPVANYLEGIDPSLCARYLEHLINERGEEDGLYHNRLAHLYLSMSLNAKKSQKSEWNGLYKKFLDFITNTHRFNVERLYGVVSPTDLYEARAILLGRMDRHDQALELYVYRLEDYLKAEEYCRRKYQPNSPTSNIFFTLLRIYLRPTFKTNKNLLTPALDLISRHSPRLDEVATLELLPPLVTAQEVRAFLTEAARAPVFDTHVVREIHKARSDQLARKLVALESQRVKVTDSRICPHCHKRIGNSVIAVHAPRGEVTHYQCREAFSQKLRETRR